MELKASLLKPYTIHERFEFLSENNYSKGYEIRETETATEAWGYTDEEIAEMERQAAIEGEVNQLKQALADSDYQAIKYAEGWLTEEQYAPIKAQREAYRERIRELENE